MFIYVGSSRLTLYFDELLDRESSEVSLRELSPLFILVVFRVDGMKFTSAMAKASAAAEVEPSPSSAIVPSSEDESLPVQYQKKIASD